MSDAKRLRLLNPGLEEGENSFFTNPALENGVILKWKFDTLNTWDGFMKYSDQLEFGQFKWKIGIRRIKTFEENNSPRKRNKSLLQFHMRIVRDGVAWYCEVKGKFKLLKQNGKDDHFTVDISPNTIFHYDSREIITNVMGEWSDLEKYGYLMDNSLIVEAHFDATFYDFNKKFQSSNISFTLNQEVVFCFNKEVLCSSSKFFYNIINNKIDASSTSVTLNHFSRYEMVHLLASLCPISPEVREENYDVLFGLADKFGIPSLLLKCEQYAKNRKFFEEIRLKDEEAVPSFQPNPISNDGGVLKWQVDDIDKWDGSIRHSDRLYTDDIGWQIGISIVEEDLVVELVLSSVPANVNGDQWLCKVNGKMKLLNQLAKDPDHQVKINPTKCFHVGMLKYQFEQSKSRGNIISDGFIKNNSIVIEIELGYVFYDFNSKGLDNMDTKIVVKGSIFHFNKEILCNYSEVFHSKLNDPNRPEYVMKIQDMEPYDFSRFLATMCPIPLKVSEENYRVLMAIAYKFKVPSLKKKCENFLIKYSEVSIAKKIELAENINCEHLMKNCLDTFKTTDDLKKFVNSDDFEKFKDATKVRILLCFMKIT